MLNVDILNDVVLSVAIQSVIVQSVIVLSGYAKSSVFIVMLIEIVLSFIKLNVTILSGIMMNVA